MQADPVEAALERALREALAVRQVLRLRIADAESELDGLHKRLEQNEAIIARTLDALGKPGRAAARPASDADAVRPDGIAPWPIMVPRPPLRRDIRPISLRLRHLNIPQAAAILLREAQAPQHVHELHNRMVENGFEFRGAHPAISIAVSLSRSKRFRRVAPGTFAIAEAIRADQIAS